MKHYMLIVISILSIPFSACQKFVDEKPDATLTTPNSLQDLRGLMDNYQLNIQFPVSTEVMADNYYLSYDNWNSIRRQYEKDNYIWKATDENNIEWNNSYKNIYSCNLVLETLKKISYTQKEVEEANQIKATALFFRASYFYSLLQLYTKAYDSSTAGEDLGIPLRVTIAFDEIIQRNSIKECYEKIITDFKTAANLLPGVTSIKSRPSKAACFGSLGRIFLEMNDFENAILYSDSCLKIYNTLMDYNDLNTASAIPIERFNPEVIFQATSVTASLLAPRICKIDSNLYNSYDNNDLRKTVYYSNKGNDNIAFKGDYDGSANNGNGHTFTGITTDEQYLIKAESLARLKRTDEANVTINNLLMTRFKKGTYIDFQINDAEVLLDTILDERRKELVFRSLRLSDLKRLNRDPTRQVTLSRELNGNLYELTPNSERYISWIPRMAIERSGIQQNP